MAYDFTSAMEFIHHAEKSGSIMGVETERELLKRLGCPQNRLKIIHIAGTNGKGSTLAMLSTILTTAGYRVGRYISPTLTAYLERIQIDGEFISEQDFAAVTERLEAAAADMVSCGLSQPTAFELETAAAFLYFSEQNCDLVVLETGMGGTYDATNVCDSPLCCVFTSIGMDHMGILGNTLEEIAANKAGIIMPKTPVVTTAQEEKVMAVLREKCLATGSSLTVSEWKREAWDIHYGSVTEPGEEPAFITYRHENEGEIRLNLAGTYQVINSCLAISCIEVLRGLGYNIDNAAVRKGLMRTEWFGRFTRIGTKPLFFVDGAHNEPAARVLRDTIIQYLDREQLSGRKLVYIMGVFADKDYDSIIRLLAPMADHIFTIATPDNPRAMDSARLAERIQKLCGGSDPNTLDEVSAESCQSIDEAVLQAIRYNGGNAAVLAFGSLSHLNEIRKAYQKWIKKR